jgi:hypothetical protein
VLAARFGRAEVSKRNFYIKAIWDQGAKVFYSESDIIGFHIEADTIQEFERLIGEHALDLVVANHITEADMVQKSLRDLIPAILWQAPPDCGDLAVA